MSVITSAVLTANNLAKSSSFTANSLLDYAMSGLGGILVTKTNTCNGNGAQTDNLFSLTGTVRIVQIYGVCTEATNSTKLESCSIDLYDGTAAQPLTGAEGSNLSGIAVGGMCIKHAAAASNIGAFLNATGLYSEGTTGNLFGGVAMKKTGVATYIRFRFTGDADTDVDVKFYVRYIPISDDGAIAAV